MTAGMEGQALTLGHLACLVVKTHGNVWQRWMPRGRDFVRVCYSWVLGDTKFPCPGGAYRLVGEECTRLLLALALFLACRRLNQNGFSSLLSARAYLLVRCHLVPSQSAPEPTHLNFSVYKIHSAEVGQFRASPEKSGTRGKPFPSAAPSDSKGSTADLLLGQKSSVGLAELQEAGSLLFIGGQGRIPRFCLPQGVNTTSNGVAIKQNKTK